MGCFISADMSRGGGSNYLLLDMSLREPTIDFARGHCARSLVSGIEITSVVRIIPNTSFGAALSHSGISQCFFPLRRRDPMLRKGPGGHRLFLALEDHSVLSDVLNPHEYNTELTRRAHGAVRK